MLVSVRSRKDVSLSRRALLVALCTVTAVAGGAGAQQSDPEALRARADSNGDGNIAWEEITALRAQTFARLDRNGDGVVNSSDSPPSPFSGRFSNALHTLQADFDADGDGEIVEAELTGAPSPLFEAGDTDGDNVLSADEILALREASAAN